MLIAASADPTIKDPRGRDAIEIARALRFRWDVIEKLATLSVRFR